MKFLFLVTCCLLSLIKIIQSEKSVSYRSQNEDLLFGMKKQLLTVWPQNGPNLMWKYTSIGDGYSSPAISSDLIFVTGKIDSIGYLFALNLTGNIMWKKAYGKEWINNFPGSRSSPTIYKDMVYVCSSFGQITCFEMKTGQMKWSINMVSDLGGINNIHGYSARLLIKNDILFCLPGGKMVNIAALDCFTGKTIWTTAAKGETAGYGDAIIVELPTKRILVCFSEISLMGIDTQTGKLLWSKELNFSGELPCNTPIYDNGYIYYVAGPGNGAVKLKLSEDGSKVIELWKNIEFDTFFGGFVKYGNYLYGAINSRKAWVSLNTETGTIGKPLLFNKGATIEVEGLLYCYNEIGEVGLIEPNNGQLKLVSSFRIKGGSNEHFAHPVIESGKLYIRHGDTLLVYNIKS